jgi:hypothetical protein
MRKPRRIVVLVVPPIEELDLVGPVQVFATPLYPKSGSLRS